MTTTAPSAGLTDEVRAALLALIGPGCGTDTPASLRSAQPSSRSAGGLRFADEAPLASPGRLLTRIQRDLPILHAPHRL